MLSTRLSVPVSRSESWRRLRLQLLLCRAPTRHVSACAAQNETSSSKNYEGTKKGRTTTKKYADLPSVYINASGVAAAPLPEWNPNYIVPPPPSEPAQLQCAAAVKPRSRTRKKANNDTGPRAQRGRLGPKTDEPQSNTSKIVQSANKAPKPATFLAREILSNLRRFPHCLLLTRVGSFYESYFDQAVEIARLLNIKLTSRKWNGERVAMCGFPISHLDRYLKILVQKEQRFVAMCEEFVHYDSNGIKEFERRISRIVTPGTLIDESFLNPFENNFLLAISVPSTVASSEPIGLAWIDVSTGEFFSKQCTFESIQDELARLAPREIVLDNSIKHSKDHPLFLALEETKCLVSYGTTATLSDDPAIPTSTTNTQSPSSPRIISYKFIFGADTPESDDATQTKTLQSRLASELLRGLDTLPTQEAFAINLLTRFLKEHLLEHMPLLNTPCHEDVKDRMQIDAHTIQGLEIREAGLDGTAKGSLLSVVKRTLTSGGTRLLSRWLCSPSTSVVEINRRQILVAFFHRRKHFRADICEIFKEMDDVGRLCQRFLLGRADFTDLIAINNAINTWVKLRQNCQDEKRLESEEQRHLSYAGDWDVVEALFQRTKTLTALSDKISQAIIVNSDDPGEQPLEVDVIPTTELSEETDTETPIAEKPENRWSINPSFSKMLSKVHAVLQDLVQQKEEMEKNLQRQYDAPSLTLRSTSQLGMFIHLARAKRDKIKVDEDSMFHSIGESLSTKTYFYRDWTVLGNKITEARIALNAAEKDVFNMLRLEVIENSEALRQNAHIIDEIDVAISFATLAEEMNFVRPEIVEGLGSYSVVNGRHPPVEMGLLSSGRQFMPNSIEMRPTSNLHIITGPNMAGKSTFLRQTALIAILAQVGSFVPADFAQLSVVDKLFSRIGAKDDLSRDRSTFMVEMMETADILRRATDKSLVIMDEVGRGTTVKDGLAIAFAALHHIATVTKSRCLFATHFHELAEMLGNTGNERGSGVFSIVRFYCSDVDDVGDGKFAYSYKLRPGINRDSHGLKVASLAGVPPSAMEVATETLAWLKSRGTDRIQPDYDHFLKSTLRPAP